MEALISGEGDNIRLLIEDKLYDEIWYNTSQNLKLPLSMNISSEIGLHCGSAAQALKRNPDMDLYLIKLKPDISYFELDKDCGGKWGDAQSVIVFFDCGIIDNKELEQLQKQLQQCWTQLEKSEVVRNFLTSKGYDAFIYKNEHEKFKDNHPGLCIFNSDIIESIIQVDKQTLTPIKEGRLINMVKLIESTQNKRKIIDNIDSMVNTMTYNDPEDYYEELFMNYGIVPTDYPKLYDAFMALDDADLYVCYTKVTEEYIKFKLQEDNLLRETKTILQDWNALDFSICAGTRLWNRVSSIQAALVNVLEDVYKLNIK